MISNVLATDIKQHFDLLKEFELRFGSKGLKSKSDTLSEKIEPSTSSLDSTC